APVPALPAAPAVGAPTSVRVVSHLGSATIIGDPTVAIAVAEGPHGARQEDNTLVIDLGLLREDDTFHFGPGVKLVNGLSKKRDGLIVRMNPNLPLYSRVRAGNVRIVGVHAPITAEVQAGDCRVEDFRSALNAFVQAGSFKAAGRLDG